ncbi:MAG: beta-eliminating lyase-related protein [Planctomycetota bacterium]|nr:beta-eliminating lyase-related protein [Planctomycetota bacterium]
MDADLQLRRKALMAQCQPFLGHGIPDATAEMARVAAWCQEHKVEQDVYGSGEFIESFEGKLAALFGHGAARFMPSGTMAQCIAMRIACGPGGHFGMHPSSHLELHEERSYSHLLGLRATLVGPFASAMLPKHLDGVTEPLHALLMELPTRENGGRIPQWDELVELCGRARERGMHLHLDGARVWQAQAAYGKSFAEIGALFDSIYVSFYKDIGALPGAMLIGGESFIKQAHLWQRRMGGNLYNLLPNVASAASRLDEKLGRFGEYRRHAIELAAALSPIEGLMLLPEIPQTSMMQVRLDLDPDEARLARDRVADASGLWLFGGVGAIDEPGRCRLELTVGEATLKTPIEDAAAAFQQLLLHRA